ncbi:MAG: bacillithiol biosynthesis cysteine-adding enzyme BshC [Bacteroidota bacterium]
MDQTATYLPYESTGYFSKIVSDYLSQSPSLQPFYQHSPDLAGLKASIAARQSFNTPRNILVEVLNEQYKGIAVSEKTKQHITALADTNTFTVTTAHQPNIFTGPLYFIYKIMHAIKLADELNTQLPEFKFVPVYYMGSEDADLDELGYVTVGGQKLVWETKQTGAVGRMKVDKALIKLIHAIHGQAGVLPFGKELNELLQRCYKEGKLVQQATLELVNALFGEYGLVVLVPDNAKLKTAFQPVVEKELSEGFSHKIVADTIAALGKNYKVQAGGRDINLFYLIDDKRERIEVDGTRYEVRTLGLSFSKEEIVLELNSHPERFSANVILRGAFQETVLPNIAFIGGGGELAYWLELKNVFAAVNIPYPVLLLRNSFLLIQKEQYAKWKQLGFTDLDLFMPELDLLNILVKRETEHQVSLANELEQAKTYYTHLRTLTDKIDKTLSEHLIALEKQALKKLTELEKKMLRAERFKYDVQQKQIGKLKAALFPNNSLQERTDNFSLYYATADNAWLQQLYSVSTGLNKGFGLVVS